MSSFEQNLNIDSMIILSYAAYKSVTGTIIIINVHDGCFVCFSG